MLYYLGRLDGQIKLNGFRVELEDVENNLVKLPNIARAAVLPVLQDGRVTALTAFVLLESRTAKALCSVPGASKLRWQTACRPI